MNDCGFPPSHCSVIVFNSFFGWDLVYFTWYSTIMFGVLLQLDFRPVHMYYLIIRLFLIEDEIFMYSVLGHNLNT